MRKLSLSIFLVLTFGAYIVYQRTISNNAEPIIAENAASNSPSSTKNSVKNTQSSFYRDGQYAGDITDAYYGNVQVKVIINNGKIINVQFLDYPQDRENSVNINSQAMPILKQEAIQSQSANVDIVSGATETSRAFIQSLSSALVKAS